LEDHTQGHALAHDLAVRAIQERFIVFANRDLQSVRDVLRTSADSDHRALAAYVLGYVNNKKEIVGDLVNAMNDPSDEVRNNAGRTLWVFADATSAIPVPYEPFVKLLHSPVWSDRNKASLALMALSDKRDPKLFELLRRRALGPLVEIARWNSEGHALPGFMLLSRMVGYSDTDAHRLWETGHRETVISAASIQH
jgi:HEAT repeat protein